jgi:hypothetical protein
MKTKQGESEQKEKKQPCDIMQEEESKIIWDIPFKHQDK